MYDNKSSEFIQLYVLLVPNESGTVFELGVQRFETFEQLEIQYWQALAKLERLFFFAQQVIRSTL